MSRRAETLMRKSPPGMKSPSVMASLKNLGGRAPNLQDSLQKEYITNLQQQIYFLELETRLLRESGGTKGQKPGEQNALVPGSLPSPSMPISAMKDRMFEEHIREARLKYQSLESQYETEIDQLRQANDRILAENESQKAEIERHHDRIKSLETEASQHEHIAEEHRTSTITASFDLQKRLDRLEATLASRQNELEQAKQRARSDRVDAASTLKSAQDELEKVQSSLKASADREKDTAEKLMRAEKELLELSENKHRPDDSSTTRALIQELEDHKAIIKRMELEKSTVEAASERRQAHCDEYLREIQELKSALAKYETRRQVNDQARDRAAKTEQKWSDELVLLRRKVDDMRFEAEQDHEAITRLQAELAAARRENIEIQEEHADLANEIEAYKEELAKVQAEIEASLSKAAGIEATNQILQKNVDDAHVRIAHLEFQIDAVIKERDQLKAHAELLQKRYSLCKSMETLKQTDLTGLLQSNLQMVKSLESITNQIKLAETS